MRAITTTTRKRRSGRRPALPLAAAALAIAALIAYFLLREGPDDAAMQNAECRMQNGGALGESGAGHDDAAMQNAECTMHNDGAPGGSGAGRDDAAPREYTEATQNDGAPGGSVLPEEPDGPAPQEKPPKHFRSPSEELLAMMLSTPPDVAMPPLPQLDPDDARLNADALSAVTNNLVIYDTDGERLERLKEDVAGAKFQLADAVAKGVSVAEALNEFREHQNEGVEIRNETIKAINALDDDQAAIETFKKANEELVKEDIAPIKPEEVGMAAAEDGGEDDLSR